MSVTPRNDLEALLVSFHNEEVDPETFVTRLLDLQIFMPVKDDKHQIAGFQASTKAEPLIIDVDDDQKVMVLFTAPERSKAFMAQFDGYSGGLLTEFSWVLRRIANGMAITLNPDDDLGFDFDPEMVAMMAGLLPAET